MEENPSRRYEPDFDVQTPLYPPGIPEQPLPSETPRGSQENEVRRAGYETHADERPLHAGQNGAANGSGVKSKEPAALFWHQPISSEEEVNWFVPPLPRREEHGGQVVGLLDKLASMMPDMPKRAWLMQWNYHTRASASAAEQADVERETDRRFAEHCERAKEDADKLAPLIEALETRERETEAELKAAQKQFAEAAAKAGLAVEPRSKLHSHAPAAAHSAGNRAAALLAPKSTAPAALPAPDPITDLHYAPSGINPQCVEAALQNEVPDLDSVAGQQGVSPIPRSTLWSTILTFFMQFLAPLVCGFMLALCLGTLVGILDLDDFSRRDSLPKFILSAALGFVIVYLMGELYSSAVHSLSRTLEMRGDEEEFQTPPALPPDEYAPDRPAPMRTTRRVSSPSLRYGMWISVGLIGAALFLGFAEVIAEGNGIRELHHQQIARRDRFRSPNTPREEELPMILYLIIGTLISGPYLVYKSSKSWGESDIQLREAWLLHQQRNWLDERRARPETGKAFELACQVEQLENSLYDIKIQLKRMQERRASLHNPEPDRATQIRRKEARAAAVGEALRLQTMVEEIVDTTEPFPSQVPARAPVSARDPQRPPALPGRNPAART